MLRVLSLSPDAVFRNASGMITMADPIRLDRELAALAVKDGTDYRHGAGCRDHPHGEWRGGRRPAGRRCDAWPHRLS